MSHKRLSEALHAGKEIQAILTNNDMEVHSVAQHKSLHTKSVSKKKSVKFYHPKLNVTLPGDKKPLKRCSTEKSMKPVPKAKVISRTSTSVDRWGIYSLTYKNSSGSELAVGFGNGGISIYNPNNTEIVKEVSAGNMYGYATMSLIYMQDKCHLISTSAGGHVSLWNTVKLEKGPEVEVHEENNEVNAADVCRDNSFFATAGKDRRIRIYDAKRFELCSTSRAPDYETMDEADSLLGHTKRIFAVRFHPQENNVFLTGGWDNCVKVWDKRILRSARKSLNGPHICGKSIDVIGNTILTGSWTAKNALQLWDLRMGEVITSLPFVQHNVYHGDFIYCAKFANTNTVLAGGSGTNGVCTINVPTKTVKNEISLEKPCYAIDSYNDGQVGVVGGLCNTIVQAHL